MKPTVSLQGRPIYGWGLVGNLVPYERLALGFLAALCTVALLRSHQPLWLLSCIGVVAVAIVAVAWWGPRSRIGGFVRDFFSVPVALTLFMLVVPLIADSNPWRADGLLASLDARWFGSLPEQWRGLLGRPDWLTDAASLA